MTKIKSVLAIYQYQTNRKSWKNEGLTNHCLSYQMRGHYDHTFSFDTLPVKKDTLFFIAKDDPYEVNCVEHGDSLAVVFEAETDLSSQIADCSDNPEIRSLFRKLLQYQNLRSSANQCGALSVLYEILEFIYKQSEAEYLPSGTKGKIHETHQFITEHFQDSSLQTKDLAAQCGISPKYFRTLFHKIHGTTPTRYLIDLRLNTASDLLTESTLPVSQIAEEVGFSDVYYFSKLFKKRFALSPKQFRTISKHHRP